MPETVDTPVVESTETTTTTETPVVETKTEPTAPVVPAKDVMSPRFAALAKKEKAIFEQEQGFKTREAQIAEKVAHVERWEKAQKAIDAEDWDAVMDHLGVTADDARYQKFMTGVTQVALRKKDLPPEVLETRRKLKQIEDERAAEKKLADDAKKAAEDAKLEAVKQQAESNKQWFLSTAVAHVKANSGDLEVLAYALSQEDQRGDVLEAIWKKTEKLEIEARGKKEPADLNKWLAAAAQDVESKLTTLYGSELQAISSLNKFKQAPPEPKLDETKPAAARAAALKQLQDGPPANPRPKSLTNGVQQAPARDDVTDDSPEACFERALKLL